MGEFTMDNFKAKLVEVFNTSELPLEAKVYVARDFMREVEDAYNKTKLMIIQNGGKEQS